jgi:hypothetical protein
VKKAREEAIKEMEEKIAAGKESGPSDKGEDS